jgi:hypothetical protein
VPNGGYGGNYSNASYSLLNKVLTTGNVIAGVGLGLTTAAIALPEVPFVAFGAIVTTGLGAAWSTYQYSIGKTSLAQHSVNGGIAAGSLATSFIPAPYGPAAGVLMRALDVSNSAVGAFR